MITPSRKLPASGGGSEELIRPAKAGLIKEDNK